jgi:hypothetical protein
VAGAARHGLRQVSYRGYEFRAPASWPVIRLATHPATCVRFDRHAIYLGRPGTAQSCPTGLVGATEAMLVQPTSTRSGAARSVEDPVAHQITVKAPRIRVTATYRADRAQILVILASAALPRPVIQSPARLAAAAATGRRDATRRGDATLRGDAAGREDASGPGGVSSTATNDAGKGFDACAAPSSAAMSAWLANSSYQAIGIYIGGSDRACAQPNLTAAWVRQQAAAGWHFFPLYVGPQVAFGEVKASSAASQAVSAAQDAVVQAGSLSFGRGTPIYYDMEAYSPSRRQAALTFFSAWTTELHALGYRSAIYSSSSSGITDLVNNYAGGTYKMPDVIDDAWWNGVPDTQDPNVPAADWGNHQRIHQYSGNVTRTYGGYTINIDKDYLDVQFGPGSGGGGGGGGRGGSATPTRQSSPAVEASGGVVDAFFAGTDGTLWSAGYRPDSGWKAAVSLGGSVASQPSAVTTSGGAVEVFYRGSNGGLQAVVSRSAGGWSRPQPLRMGRLGSAPLAVSTADGGIDVFWRGVNPSQLWGARLVAGAGWHGPYHLAANLASAPSPAVSGASMINVFWRGTDGRLWHISRTTSRAWNTPAALPMGQLGSGPYAAGQRGGQIDVFWGGTGRGSIWHATYSLAGGWSRQSLLSRGRRSALALVASSAGTADAFWKGRHRRLWYASGHTGSGWGSASVLVAMGKISGDVFAAARPDGTIDVFWRGTGVPHLWHARYHSRSSRWTGPNDLGGNVL